MLDPLQQIVEQQAASLDASVRDKFLEPFAKRSRSRATTVSMAALQPPASNVPLAWIEGELATHPCTAEYFGSF